MPTTRRELLGLSISAPLACMQAGTSRAPAAAGFPADAELGRTPHTRFAVNVEMWWRRLPFVERLRQAAALGFPAVEFWPWRGKDLDAVGGTCEELGLEVAQFTAWGFQPGLADGQQHDAFVAEVQASCDVAQRLGAKAVTIVAGNDVEGLSKAEMHAHVIAGLRRAAPVAERADVTLILEPMNGRVDHPGHCLYGSADALAICAAVGSSHVKINWDLYHMQIEEGDLCGHLREGIEWIGYLQLADHPGRHEPGTGEVHYPRVLRAAHELGYRGFVGLECSPESDELLAARRVWSADQW